MQVVGPINGQVAFPRGRVPRDRPLGLLPWGLALALGAAMAASAPPARLAADRDVFVARSAGNWAFPSAGAAAKPYGALIDFFPDAGWASSNRDSLLRASLDAGPEVLAAQSAVDLPSAAAAKVSSPYGALVDFFSLAKSPSPSRDFPLLASLEAAPPAAAAAEPAPPDVPLPPKRDVAMGEEAAPQPPARPAEPRPLAASAPDRRSPPPSDRIARATPPADDRPIFQRLFGQEVRPGPADGSAAPDGGAAGVATDRASGWSVFAKSTPSGFDQWTAVYDISARTVFMPDGTRLEAHSGLGDRLDDPRYVNERGRGATPPHLYELGPREELFHGVAALRLTPIGGGDVFGRAGLLAHSYMLGPNGDSNGCVSFKDYDAFLHAFRQGQVKRLAVVARLD
jgi:hypothetical protein